MFILANKRIPDNKKISIALTYVFGIGKSLANELLQKAQVEDKKTSDLTIEESDRLVKESEFYVLEDKLREEVQKKRNEKIRLGTYHGRRLEKGLPVHGQSTRHNARTAKRKRKVVITSKKQPKTVKTKKTTVVKKKKK